MRNKLTVQNQINNFSAGFGQYCKAEGASFQISFASDKKNLQQRSYIFWNHLSQYRTVVVAADYTHVIWLPKLLKKIETIFSAQIALKEWKN